MALIASRRERIINSAEKLVARGRLEAAIKEYRKVLKETEDDTNTLNRVGDLYARLHRIDEAVELFGQISGLYERDGFFVKAIAIQKKILRLDPSQIAAHGTLGDLYRRQGLVIEARAQYQRLAERRRDDRDLEGSRELHRKMLELEPESLGNMPALVDLFEVEGRVDEARNGYRFMAERMLHHEDPEGAGEVYARALEAGFGDPEFIAGAVTELRRHDQSEAAERMLAEALEQDPESVELLSLVGAGPEVSAAAPSRQTVGEEAGAKTAGDATEAPDAGSVPAKPAPGPRPRQPETVDLELDLEQIEQQILEPDEARVVAGAEDAVETSGEVEDEAEVVELLAEIAVFIKYDLEEKAIEGLESLLASRPNHMEATRQLLHLQLKRRDPEAVVPLAQRLLQNSAEDRQTVGPLLEAAGYRILGDRVERPAESPPPAETAVPGPRDAESVEANVAWLEELAQETRAKEPATLFESEDEFFDLAAELEDELDTDVELAVETAGGSPKAPSLDRIVETFRQKIGESLSATDFDTHFNLGIAYREMGLLDESISEFQLAAKDSRYLVDCCSLLGTSFLEKGFPDLAVKWYRRGLDSPTTESSESLGLLYELGSLYQSIGDLSGAQESYGRITAVNPGYRDVAARLRDLELRVEG